MKLLAKCERCERIREITSRGLCSGCYTSWKRWMNPTAAKQHAANYREKHREEIRQYQKNWIEQRRAREDDLELAKDANIVKHDSNSPLNDIDIIPVGNEIGRGHCTIAMDTPYGRGWIIGSFRLIVDPSDDD